MAFSTLISTGVLASHLDDPVIVDCRFKLDDEAWGAREYASLHIPGATYAHLDRDLSGPTTGTNGRHPLPDPQTLAATFSRLGIAGGVQVVAYDQDNGMYASRLWWLLRWLGHDAVAVLDGGLKKWIAEGRPTASGDEHRAPREFSGLPRADMAIDVRAVSSLAGKADWKLVDARAPERYRGEIEPLDKKPGHIPGAANHFFQWNLDEGGRSAHLRHSARSSARRSAPATLSPGPITSSATADRASPRATTCSPWSTRGSRARSCIRDRGVSGRATLRGQWQKAEHPAACVDHLVSLAARGCGDDVRHYH